MTEKPRRVIAIDLSALNCNEAVLARCYERGAVGGGEEKGVRAIPPPAPLLCVNLISTGEERGREKRQKMNG